MSPPNGPQLPPGEAERRRLVRSRVTTARVKAAVRAGVVFTHPKGVKAADPVWWMHTANPGGATVKIPGVCERVGERGTCIWVTAPSGQRMRKCVPHRNIVPRKEGV